MELKSQIDLGNLPRHIAVIMDGNGRWAKKHGKPRVFGHKSGVRSVREFTEGAAELGVEYLTLYAFSTENWNRPRLEVDALMGLLVDTIRKEIQTLQKNDIRLRTIGDTNQLPPKTKASLIRAIEETENNQRMTLTLALNYSGRWDLIQATQKISERVASGEYSSSDIDDEFISQHLQTSGMPDPEMLIRTSGELRISNFLLWQLAYSELFFIDKLWPEVTREDLFRSILSYQQRERRFGMISDQIA